MKLYHILQSYGFDELMPVINEMFPGTNKYKSSLENAYNIMASLKPVISKKTITYKVIPASGDESYMGADDKCFEDTWEVCLGKEILKTGGVNLNEAEIAANCIVNMCFLGRYPKEFEPFHADLLRQRY
jgi:hypothetical protein